MARTDQIVLEHWTDMTRTTIPAGAWAKLARPQMHCEGWGTGGRNGSPTSENCAGGTGVHVTARARWVRFDGVLQCGTCHRHDVARTNSDRPREDTHG